VVVEGDEHSVWAYVLKHSQESIGFELDGFICSLGPLIECSDDVKTSIDQCLSPPLLKEYANEFSLQPEIKNEHITIDWHGNEISIKVNGIVFLIMDIENRKSYSKGVSKNGPYGIPLTEKKHS
jgi:hypothetical protein